MNVGGVEKSLISLLRAIPADKYELHLALIYPGGPLDCQIPPSVKIHVIDPYRDVADFVSSPFKTTLADIARGRVLKSVSRLWSYALTSLRGSYNYLCKRSLERYRPDWLETVYDLAVDYGGPSEMLDWFVTRHVKAKRRALWIHFDLNLTFNRRKSAMQTWGEYNRIFCVSENCREVVDRRYPSFAGLTDTFFNIVNSREVIENSLLHSPFTPSPEGVVDIVTVARLSFQKGIDIALRAIPILRSKGIRLMWHFMGSGDQAREYEKLAESLDVKDCVRFYGAVENPYPAMRAADVYVQPSRCEGYGITIAEAKLFGAPIVTSDSVGAAEQLGNGQKPNSIILDKLNPRALADAVEKAMTLPRMEATLTPSKDLHKLLELVDGSDD